MKNIEQIRNRITALRVDIIAFVVSPPEEADKETTEEYINLLDELKRLESELKKEENT